MIKETNTAQIDSHPLAGNVLSGADTVIQVLAERFESQRLPRALRMKERVDQGETLTDLDIEFLEEKGTAAELIEKHREFTVAPV